MHNERQAQTLETSPIELAIEELAAGFSAHPNTTAPNTVREVTGEFTTRKLVLDTVTITSTVVVDGDARKQVFAVEPKTIPKSAAAQFPHCTRYVAEVLVEGLTVTPSQRVSGMRNSRIETHSVAVETIEDQRSVMAALALATNAVHST